MIVIKLDTYEKRQLHLKRLRQLDRTRYFRNIFVASGLWLPFGCFRWSRKEENFYPIVFLPDAVACMDSAGLVQLPEIHICSWKRTGYAGLLNELCKEVEEDWILSLHERQIHIREMLPEGSVMPMHRNSEVLMVSSLEPAKAASTTVSCFNSNNNPHDISGDSRVVSLRNHGKRACVETGAYNVEMVKYLETQVVDALVLVAEDGRWLSRCYLAPRDCQVVEICGLITREEYRKKGRATKLVMLTVEYLRRLGVSAVYLTQQRNRAAVRVGTKSGLRQAATYKKFRIKGSLARG